MKLILIHSALLILFSITSIVAENEEWSFIVLADWHGAEAFALTRSKSPSYDASIEVLSHIKNNYGGDLVILPGDTNSGKWYLKSYIKKLAREYDELDESMTPNEAIAFAGGNCYRTIKEVFSKAGYDTILLSIGDHEIGDNPWNYGTHVYNGLPVFRRALAKELNEIDTDNNGGKKFRFSKPIGNVPSRPLGTIFEETSFAYVHNNALFITVDVYKVLDENYFDRSLGEGDEGAVTGTLSGDHLEWFKNLLIEADNDTNIKHKFVQGHIPVLGPVRKMNSSSMSFDKGIMSDFWQLMRKYRVDVYFAGEVHALTVTKDPKSSLIQIVSRGNRFSNFLRVGNIREDGFKIEVFNEVGEKYKWNANYNKYGELDVTKLQNGETVIKDSGALKMVDVNADPLISFKFNPDEKYPINSRQIVGFKYDNFKTKLVGDSKTIRGQKAFYGLENHGEFGQQYDAQIVNLDFINTTTRGSVGAFQMNTRVAVGSMGPLAGGTAFSCAVKFKTTNNNHMILISYSDAWSGPSSSRDMFIMTLEGGKPKVYINDETYFQGVSSQINLSNGEWHKIFIKMPSKSCLLSEVEMFINNVRVKTEVIGKDHNLFFTSTGYLTLGGWGYSSFRFGGEFFQGTQNFIGMIKSFDLWMKNPAYLEAKFEDGFTTYRNRRCRASNFAVRHGIMTYESCLSKCRSDVSCKGFETRIRKQRPNELHACFLFMNQKPALNSKKFNGSKCGIKP